MIGIGVRQDGRVDRLGCHGRDLRQLLARIVDRVLGVNHDHAGVTDHEPGVGSAAADPIRAPFEVMDSERDGAGTLLSGGGDGRQCDQRQR